MVVLVAVVELMVGLVEQHLDLERPDKEIMVDLARSTHL
jgi:hypothetical protein